MKRKLISIILCVAVLFSLLTVYSTPLSAGADSSNPAPSLIVNILNPDGTTTLVHQYTGTPVYAADNTTLLYYTYPELEAMASTSYYATIDAMPAAVGTKAWGVTLNDLVDNAKQYNPNITWASGQKIVLYAIYSPSTPYQTSNFYTYDFVQGQARYYYPNMVGKYTAYRDNGEDTNYLEGWNDNPTPVQPMLCLASFQERYATDTMLKETENHTYTFGVPGTGDYREITTPVTMNGAESLRFCMGLTPTEAAKGVAGSYSSTNKFCQWIYRLDIGPVSGPALFADTTVNLPGQPITLTYTDNDIWRNAINRITVDNITIDPSFYTIAAGTITFNAGVFTTAGSHIVVVASTGFMNAKVTQKIGALAPVAAFTSDIQSGPAPVSINFNDQSSNNPTAWSWDFNNDGTVDSTQPAPSFVYASAGIYSVKLSVSNSAGSDDEVKTDYITVTTAEVVPWDGVSSSTDWTGSGTPEAPYIISTAAQLKGLADQVNSGTPCSGVSFKLGADINLANFGWTPIGGHCPLPICEEGWPTGDYFGGVFDGDNYTISGINISNPAADTGAYGLFGYVEGGLIANLNVAGLLDMGDNSVSMIGSVVGYTTGSLYNLHSSMSVYTGDPTYTTASQAGGIAGAVRNTSSSQVLYVRYCSNSGSVTARGRIGGIVGAVYCVSDGGVVVDQCYNTGDIVSVFSQMKIFTGGIVGYCRGYITNCYNQGEMTTNNGHYLAGLCGILQGANPVASMSNCYSTAVFHNYATGWDRWLWGSADRSAAVHINNCFWLPNAANSDITQPNEDDSWGTQTFVSAITDAELQGTSDMTESNRSGTFSGNVVDHYLGAADMDNPYGTYGFAYAAPGEYPVLAWQLIPDFKVDLNNLLYPSGTFSIVASVTGGSGTANVSPAAVSLGGSATVTLNPAEGYHLSAITDNGVDVMSAVTGNTYIVSNITANHTVQVTFSNDTYILNYTAGAHGSLSGALSQNVARGGSGTAVNAAAESGYHFVMWTDRSTTNPRTDVNISADLSVRAIFIADDSGTSPDYFTLAVLPDTQNYAENYPEIFYQQTQWIADNAGSQNIVFVAHLGDLQDDYSVASEWQNARGAMDILRAAEIPYSIAPGNHDLNFNTGDTTNFDKYFPCTDFADYSWYGGHYPQNSNANSYQLFSAMGQDFVILNLVCTPSLLTAETITWANAILDAYSSRKVIVITHGYIDDSGNYLNYGSVSGATIRAEIVLPHHNVVAVLCGHYSGQYHSADNGTSGNTIYNILSDYQNDANGGNGWLRLYQFYPQENKIEAVTYSPFLDQYDTSTNGRFDLSPYESFSAGDINNDGEVDILDVVKTVNFVLKRVTPTTAEFAAADCNDDGYVDILDVVKIVNKILKRE